MAWLLRHDPAGCRERFEEIQGEIAPAGRGA
jgi:hypothetical protein